MLKRDELLSLSPDTSSIEQQGSQNRTTKEDKDATLETQHEAINITEGDINESRGPMNANEALNLVTFEDEIRNERPVTE